MAGKSSMPFSVYILRSVCCINFHSERSGCKSSTTTQQCRPSSRAFSASAIAAPTDAMNEPSVDELTATQPARSAMRTISSSGRIATYTVATSVPFCATSRSMQRSDVDGSSGPITSMLCPRPSGASTSMAVMPVSRLARGDTRSFCWSRLPYAARFGAEVACAAAPPTRSPFQLSTSPATRSVGGTAKMDAPGADGMGSGVTKT
mmetsp:Transcript_9872/g.31179  ORF Transcript_9872/g.31179 Transcript_9872/m.31179 type:complete len:205 (-) Transcript_9872:63-677(-)